MPLLKYLLLTGNFPLDKSHFITVNGKASWPFENRTAVTKEERLRQRKNCVAIDKDKAARLRGAIDNFLITVPSLDSFSLLVTVLFVAEMG